MALGEFELIRRFFTAQAVRHRETVLGIGDDGAVLCPPPDHELVVTVDTLVSGVHFLPTVDPERLGHKALAVNLSDLAAMGAEPRWASLALTLPEADPAWLAAFARGFFRLAERHGVELIGGDTTQGPLAITVQALGWVPRGAALRRSGARPGDRIYLSGPMGCAGLGLKIRLGQVAFDDAEAVLRLEQPEPRVELGVSLRGIASACIDVSDGLAADLGHLLEASAVGAVLEFEQLPLTEGVRRYLAGGDWRLPLVAGDDYELCFTAPAERVLAASGCVPVGHIVAERGLWLRKDGRDIELLPQGYEHFA